MTGLPVSRKRKSPRALGLKLGGRSHENSRSLTVLLGEERIREVIPAEGKSRHGPGAFAGRWKYGGSDHVKLP